MYSMGLSTEILVDCPDKCIFCNVNFFFKRGDGLSIKINEPYEGSSIYSEYMTQLKKMTDDEVKEEYFRLRDMVEPSQIDVIKKSIVVDFIVRFNKEYLLTN